MAHVLGSAGRYVSDELARKRRKILLLVLAVIAVLGVIAGMLVSSCITLSWLGAGVKIVLMLMALAGVFLIGKWGDKEISVIEKERDKQARGAAGEHHVANILSALPDDFYVINNLSTPNGDLDHVVVGPTGVFVIDTKAWRGVIAADGKGELLLNGKPDEKASLRKFVGRMMGVREKMLVHLPGLEVRFNALYVFTSAWVEARWGSTGNVICVTDDKLYSYIIERDFGNKLSPETVKQLAQTFLGLAHMDSDFTAKASV